MSRSFSGYFGVRNFTLRPFRSRLSPHSQRTTQEGIVDDGADMTVQRGIPICPFLVVWVTLVIASSLSGHKQLHPYRGTVSDPRAAIVSGAGIMLENVDTEGARMTVIDNFGGYQVPRVQPGTYPIRAELAGFK